LLIGIWSHVIAGDHCFIARQKTCLGWNLGKRRSSIDVVAQIIQMANGGATRTGLMNACGLSYKSLKKHVILLAEKGLLEYEPMGEKYKPTEKGYQFLQTYDQMNMLTGLIEVIKQRHF
jgi:predicted transcriptional regulator